MRRFPIVVACLVALLGVGCARKAVPAQSGAVLPAGSSSSLSAQGLAQSAASTSSRIFLEEDEGILSVVQRPDHRESQAGQTVTYAVTVRNLSTVALADAYVELTFPLEQASLLSASGGVVDENHVVWKTGAIAPMATVAYEYSLFLHPQLRSGAVVTTLVEAMATNAIPQLATTEVRVIGALPETGAEARYFAPIEDASRYLTPLR